MSSNSLYPIVLQRLWQGVGGILTVAFIAHFLTPEKQGWFYTFISIASLNFVFEMGLSAALIQISAHMFNKIRWLSDGRVVGDNAKVFLSFFVTSFRVYVLLSMLFFTIVFFIGFFIFKAKTSTEISNWLIPWIFLMLATAFNMLTIPFLSVSEGSGELHEVYLIRLLQGILGSVLTWLVLFIHGSLWAASMPSIASFTIACIWVISRKNNLLKLGLSKSRIKNQFDWGAELWPLQWRIGLNWMSVFLISQICTPFLFYYQTPKIAGQLGLSLTIVNMLGLLSQSWIVRRVPMMSNAVANKEWELLDKLFKKDLQYSLLVFIFGAFFILVGYQFISYTSYADRVLDFQLFLGLLVFTFFNYINISLSTQIRSFKKEPLVWVSLLGAFFIIINTWVTTKEFSVNEMIFGMVLIQILFIFPASFFTWKLHNKIYRV